MPDISIPGVNSKYKTEQVVENLVNIEKKKLTKLEEEKNAFQDDKAIWQNINRLMKAVRDSAHKLYDFENPFDEKIGASSNEKSLIASAKRTANNGDYKVKILHPAKNDRFLSKDLPLDTEIPKGLYVFQVGDKNIDVHFQGGRLDSFVETINAQEPSLLKSSLIRNTTHTQVLSIEAVPVGAKNVLQFVDATKELMTNLGVVGPAQNSEKTLLNSAIDLAPQEKKILKGLPEKLSKTSVLEVQYAVVTADASQLSTDQPKNFAYPEGGSVTYRDIRIDNSPMQGGVLPPQPPSPPQDVRDLRVLTVTGEGKSLALDDLLETGKTEVLRFPLGEQLQLLDEIKLENHNTLRKIHISSIKVVDPAQRSDFRPVHPLSQAEDAEIEIDGVRVVRDTNQLSDVIPGVELLVVDSSPEVLKVTIGPDKKKIKDSIIDYLVNYNRMMGELLVLTSLRPKKDTPLTEREQSPIIQAAVYHTEEERKTAAKNLGRYQGESFLNQIKNNLQLLMMNPYSSKGTRFNLLADIGISGSQAGAQDLTQRRGYLNLDEKKLDEALETDVSSVRKLFGMDTSGDLVVDYGAAYLVGELLKPSIQLGGLNASRISSFDKQMQIKDQEIDNYKKYLARYEADLKRKYRIMESTLNSMENNSSRIENLNRTK